MRLTPEEQIEYDQWVSERPPAVQEAIKQMSPLELYYFKDSGYVCHIYAYEEDEQTGEITLTVEKTGTNALRDDPMTEALAGLHTNRVSGVKMSDLLPYTFV